LLEKVNNRFEGEYVRIDNDHQFELYIKQLKYLWKKNEWMEIQSKLRTPESRTQQQNNALHLWFNQCAIALNDAGYDMKKVFSKNPDFQIYWTGYGVKEYLYKAIQEAMFGSKSTAKLEKGQVSQIYDILNEKFADWGIHVPFPSDEIQKM
jgi:hypothetical protein